jgi:hypothetical protein
LGNLGSLQHPFSYKPGSARKQNPRTIYVCKAFMYAMQQVRRIHLFPLPHYEAISKHQLRVGLWV